MSTNLKDTVETLNTLIETCKDGQEGFRLASEAIAEDDDLKTFLFSCSLQRSKFAGDLQSELQALGESAAERGSVSSAVHRGWIGIKSVVTNRDNHAILAECERGEDVAVAQYRKAVDSGLSDPLRDVVQQQFQEVLATHNSVRDMRDELASQKRSAGEVIGDLKSSLNERGRAIGASAAEGWEGAQARGGEVLRNTEIYVRENPIPAILTALGVGFVLGLLVRSLEHDNDDKIEVPIPRSVRKVRDYDYKAAALPFLWPIVKFFSSNYASSKKTVNRAYSDANEAAAKAYKKAMKQAGKVDVSKYVDPVVKRVKKSF